MICAKCLKRFDGEPPKYKKINDKERVTLVFCSKECMASYG